MGFGLLGAHVSSTVQGLPEAIVAWQPPLAVLLDFSDVWHDVKAQSPNTVFIGRIFQENEPDFNNPDLDPRQAARDHNDQILPWAERMGETCSFWQGVNEPVLSSQEAAERYAEFDAERTMRLYDHGFRVAVGSFSVGTPDLAYWNHYLPALEAARQYGGMLALHEYAWPTLDHQWPWLLLRHRKVYDGEPAHGWAGLPDHLKTVPLAITECGLDGLLEPGHPPRGWQVIYGGEPEEYMRQLAWYASELDKDPYVIGAAIYCLATPDALWRSYDIWPEPAGTLARQAEPLYRLPEMVPPEEVMLDQALEHLDRIVALLQDKLQAQ